MLKQSMTLFNLLIHTYYLLRKNENSTKDLQIFSKTVTHLVKQVTAFIENV